MAKTRIVEGEKQLHERILEDITSGEIAGGSRLKVQELASKYGTSINPIREVLRQLQGQGIVEILPNRGAEVPTINADTLRDIFEILKLYEPYFVSWYAEQAHDDDIAELEQIQAQIERLPIESRVEFTKLDAKFHQIISHKHYNKRAIEAWASQRTALQVFSTRIPISRARYKQVFKEHRALIDAFRKNDVVTAVSVIDRHVIGAGENMYRQLRMK